jgi:hypothetical protein
MRCVKRLVSPDAVRRTMTALSYDPSTQNAYMRLRSSRGRREKTLEATFLD